MRALAGCALLSLAALAACGPLPDEAATPGPTDGATADAGTAADAGTTPTDGGTTLPGKATSIAITGPSSLYSGESATLTATVSGTGSFSQDLIWSPPPMGLGTLSCIRCRQVTLQAPVTTSETLVRVYATSASDAFVFAFLDVHVHPGLRP